jgi:uncharacterized PurR-regulated membrane protein YhhQ (DUF165 family)
MFNKSIILITIYLMAIVAANIAATIFGPAVTILDAFLFIGLNMATRDRLHIDWEGRSFWPKMLALIAIGGALSWLLTSSAGPIAVGSTVSFLAASLVDACVFSALKNKNPMVRINGSNAVSAAVDSIVFPTIAFGSLLPLVILGQWLAKTFGGFIWSLLLRKNK